MRPPVQARCVARASVIKALAHPTRVFVVEELSRHGKRCVCELTETVGADMSTVSRHLAILKSAGIVRDEKRGSQVYYRLSKQCIAGFLRCVDKMVQRNAQKRRRFLRV